MNDTPLVSVILPTYNRAATLMRAVSSVLDQTYANLELIVVDDASNDNTVALLEAIEDDRVQVILQAERGGGGAARNAGIAAASGTLIAFQDSDDFWEADKLSRQVAALAAAPTHVGICICGALLVEPFQETRATTPSGVIERAEIMRRILNGEGYPLVGWLVRREALASAGPFEPSLPRLQDYELSIRLARECDFLFVEDVLLRADIGADSLSASADKYERALDIVLDRHATLFNGERAGKSHMIFRAGKYHALSGSYRRALRFFLRAFRTNPANLRALAGALLIATGTFPLLRKARYS